MTQSITRLALRDWLAAIISERTLIAPRAVAGIHLFRPVETVDDIAFDYGQSALSPKEWFFPPSDTLFTIRGGEGAVTLEAPLAPTNRVLFGLRPCDARALTILDRLFLAPPADALYRARRERTLLVGLACAKQQLPECFCTSLGGGPQETANVDVLLAEAGDYYAVEIVTEKGRALMAGAALDEVGRMPASPAISNRVPTDGMAGRIRADFANDYWATLADRCIGCKMCTYVCPTCHCFDVRDCTEGTCTERVRSWDGCQSPQFTRLAGGYNPRSSKAARLRQFYAHKYMYFPERFGVTQCVGCGRCAHACPVNIDIRETLRDLQTVGGGEQ